MQTVTLSKLRDGAALKKLPATAEHAGRIITVPPSGLRLCTPDGKLLAAVVMARPVPGMRAALLGLSYKRATRTDGMAFQARTFGALPRNVLRRDFCCESAMRDEYPQADAFLKNLAPVVGQGLAQIDPALYQRQVEIVSQQVRPDWQLPGGAFTSGIVNLDNRLTLHCDNQNFPDLYSGMLTLRRCTEGGALALPEYGVALDLPDWSLLYFQGQRVLHGVLPFQRTRPDGHRITAVYYAMEPLCKCGTAADELKRIQGIKTARTQKRAVAVARVKDLDLSTPPRWPLFIPSRGRAQRAPAAKALRGAGLPFSFVVEPHEVEAYRILHPDAGIVVLPESNKGLAYARQYLLAYARRQGFPWIWQIDDNIGHWLVKINDVMQVCPPMYVLREVEQRAADDPRVALAGTDYRQFAALATRRETRNTRINCCVLARTDTGIDYRAATSVKEDLDFALQCIVAGHETLLCHDLAMDKPAIASWRTGGQADDYRAGRDAVAANALVDLWPGIATLIQKRGRVDVKIDWAEAVRRRTG